MYAAFGVTRGAARLRAEKLFKPFKKDGSRKTLEEAAQELSELTDKYFDEMKDQQLSFSYESMQEVVDYIEITKNIPARNVHIKKKVPNGINPKTKKEKLKWVRI